MHKPHGLGRVYKPDLRDKNYLLKKPTTKAAKEFRLWHAEGVLDQKETPMCVGYACAKWVEAGPVTNPLPDPEAIYHEAQKLDDASGEDYEGTTVRGGMKALKERGIISSYHWTYDLATLSKFILEKGPLVLGTTWYENMFYPDDNSNVSVSGEEAGGHCYLAIGVNTLHHNPDDSVGAVRVLNSWGESWGDKGRGWISFNDMKKLLKNGGEAAYGLELKVK